jgi:predicted RNA methylase
MIKKYYSRDLPTQTDYLVTNYGEFKKNPRLNQIRKPFVPELEPELIDYDEELFKKHFPHDKNINFKKLKISNIGKYSMDRPDKAQMLSDLIKKYMGTDNLIITDANSNMGGNAINFAKNFKFVNSVEIIPFHCDILRNNLGVYDLLDKVEIHCKDYLDVMNDLKQDVVFFDPPWGGPDYKSIKNLNLYLDNINIIDIINEIYDNAELVVLRIPRNFNIVDFLRRIEYTNVNIYKIYVKPDVKIISSYILFLKK